MFNFKESQKDKQSNTHNHYYERMPIMIKKDTPVTPIKIQVWQTIGGTATVKDWKTMTGNWELYITSWELYIISFPSTLQSSKSKKHQPWEEAVTMRNWRTVQSAWEIQGCINLCRL